MVRIIEVADEEMDAAARGCLVVGVATVAVGRHAAAEEEKIDGGVCRYTLSSLVDLSHYSSTLSSTITTVTLSLLPSSSSYSTF